MNSDQLISNLKNDNNFIQNVTSWQVIPASNGEYTDFPPFLDSKIIKALNKRGVNKLYSHQAKSLELANERKDFVVVTPTASGKTLCYNIPVLSEICRNPDSRALYLFPTKALSADQSAELYDLINAIDIDIKAYTYDGDTQNTARKAIRQAGHIVVTNPDMLHANILPNHTKWVKLFENLKFIVIDEIHIYRGVFGSNFSNVIRRLVRLCEFYGSKPQFILCSATINNPEELAKNIISKQVEAITKNGAPCGEKNFVFYNPPVINKQLGIRKGVVNETRAIAQNLLANKIPTIIFAKSRVQVEIMTHSLKHFANEEIGKYGRVHGYRGGYLPSERRKIEKGLRNGDIDMVISTNALELGIDIGSLSACVLCGYPGTIASTWQQAGRAGRRQETSLTIFVASSSPIDQYIVNHPTFFMNQSPENAQLQANNLYILLSHFKCAAYELPFSDDEKFGDFSDSQQLLDFLTDANILRHVNNKYYWSAEDFPASEISLRSTTTENFVIIDITNPSSHKVIGEMDRFTVPMLLHENAIYMHEGKQYQVEKLDFKACKAFLKSVNVDYYTDADLNVSLSVLDELKNKTINKSLDVTLGELKITSIVKIFKKMKLDTHENLGFGQVRLPETDMHTVGMWWTLPSNITNRFSNDDLQCAMISISNLVSIIAPLYLMCASRDIKVIYQVKAPITGKPTIFMYDCYPGGVGLSEKAYEIQDLILNEALNILKECKCDEGCPNCIGPVMGIDKNIKNNTKFILESLVKLCQA